MKKLTGHGCSLYYGRKHLLAKIIIFCQRNNQHFVCYLPVDLKNKLENQFTNVSLRKLQELKEILVDKGKLEVTNKNILLPVSLLITEFTKGKVYNWEEKFATRILEANNLLICLYDISQVVKNSEEDNLLLNYLLKNHDYLISSKQIYRSNDLNKERPS